MNNDDERDYAEEADRITVTSIPANEQGFLRKMYEIRKGARFQGAAYYPGSSLAELAGTMVYVVLYAPDASGRDVEHKFWCLTDELAHMAASLLTRETPPF